MREAQSARVKRALVVLVATFVLVLAIVRLSQSFAPEQDKILVAYGDDTAGMVMMHIMGEENRAAVGSFDYINVGDCCGSNAQFSFSTGEVDAAILCPDAVENFMRTNTDFVSLGTLTYGANVYVYRDDSPAVPSVVGYMNQRDEQRDIIAQRFGSEVQLQPMMTSGLIYALQSKQVDAIMLDVTIGLKSGFAMEPIAAQAPASILVVRSDLVGTDALTDFVTNYNAGIDELADDGQMSEMLGNYLEQDGQEALSRWKRSEATLGKLAIPQQTN